MRPEQWEQLEALFAKALQQPAQERDAFMATATSDPAMSVELRALLHAHEARGRLDSISDRLRRPRPSAALSFETVVQRMRPELPDRYGIERELGRGGMAIVLLAQDRKHHRYVALKVLHPDLAVSLGAARFLQEIAFAAKLTHPHILPLHDSGEAGGLLYYVMPYVEGESLRDRLRREEKLSVVESVEIARQVAGALGYAHGRDIVHRDIKPENILLEAGHAVVSDFGIARAMSAAGGDELSETGIVLGTPAYMSPEQVIGARDLDGRTDLYSLACVLYEMLAGHPPFSGPTTEEVLQQQLTAMARPLRAVRSDVPELVERVVGRALAKARTDRFPDPASFGDALPLPGALTVAATRRWRGAVIAAMGVVAAAAAATALTHQRTRVDPTTTRIAVLPLVPTAPDTGLARLGRDLVVTLSADLDGVRRVRTVDALTVLAQTRTAGALALQPGLQLAGLLGATGVVHGAIARVGDQVRLDVGLFRSDDGTTVSRASVTADPRDIASITDALATGLLRGTQQARSAEVPGLGSMTTRSLQALQAFLEGEHAIAESRWQEAAASYARAIRADSTFWLAYWRFAYAREWYLNLDDQGIIEAIKAHRTALPERDRLVFESWLTDSVELALARAREAVDRYPEYWPGWMQYGDWLFHGGPVYGHPLSEAQVALERAVALNPNFTAAWEHLLWVTLQRDTVAAAGALAALQRLDYPRAATAELGFDLTRVYRLELVLARSGTLDRALLDSIADDLTHRARVRVGGGADMPRVQVELSRRVLRAHPRTDLAEVHERLLADAWASRGAWDSALAVAERHVTRSPNTDKMDAYRLAVIATWVGALPPAEAWRHRALPASAAARPTAAAAFRAELAWLDGLLAAAARDRGALAAARATLQRLDTMATPVLDRSLAAFDAELAGARRNAARTLAALNWEQPDVLAPGYALHPYVIAISRLAAARWLLAEGDTAAAVRPLMWFDALWALDGYRPARRVLSALAMLERARLEEQRRDIGAARAGYATFLGRYDVPTPLHRQLVTDAGAALVRLTAVANEHR